MNLLLRYTDPLGRPRARVLRGTILLGREAGTNRIVLDDDSIAGLHATIDADASPPIVSRVSGEAAVFVNGILVKTSPLADGDMLRLGDVSLRVLAAARWLEIPIQRLEAVTAPVNESPSGRKLVAWSALAAILVVGIAGLFLSGRLAWRARLDPADSGAALGRLRPTPTAAPAARVAPTLPAELKERRAQAPTVAARELLADIPGARSVATLQDAPAFLEAALDSVVSISGDVSVDRVPKHVTGSGFFVSSSGLVLTNAHVMGFEGTYWASAHDGRQLGLLPRERDLRLDLGILAVVGEGPFPVLPFGSSLDLRAGASVYAIGSPVSAELSFSVTRGIVSSRTRTFEGRSFVQHDAAINPGNSGGPLLDGSGRVVGINTWKIAGVDKQGLSFAIPIEVAEEALRVWKVRR